MTPRKEGWEDALYGFLERRKAYDFAWGSSDCALMASDWILEATGVDPAADLRGAYRSALGAVRIMRARGGLEKIADEACAANGWLAVPVTTARRGDIVMLDDIRLGICTGVQSAFPGKSGLTMRRTRECRKAWRIG